MSGPATGTDLARRDADAQRLVERCGYAAAALALLPVPLSETVGVMGVHVAMVVGLARLHGVELTSDHAGAMVLRLGGAIGASYLGTRAALGLAKVVLPVLPGLVAAPLVFGATLGLGAVVRASFADGVARELEDDEVRAIYAGALARAQARFDPRRVADPEARAAAEEVLRQAGAPAGPGAAPAPEAAPTPPAPEGAVVPGAAPASEAAATLPLGAAPARPPLDDAVAALRRDRLERLRRLRDEGILLDEEYEVACRQVADEG